MQIVATKTERESFGVFTLFGADADIAANHRSGMISTPHGHGRQTSRVSMRRWGERKNVA